LASGATLGADAGSLIDFSGVPAGSELQSVQEGLTALAGGGQSGATAITASYVRFTTVAADHNSGVLPAAKPGVSLTVINAGVAILDVFPAGGDAINALGASTAFSMAATKVALFVCTLAGQWHSTLGA